MDLNLFNNKEIDNNKDDSFISKFIKELKNAIDEGKKINEENNTPKDSNINKENNDLEEYNLYEKKKIFLDNRSHKGNDLAWIMDDKSVCISEHGDGGPYAIDDIDLPEDAKVGEVYEKIDGKYIYNSKITEELSKVSKQNA